MEAKELMLNDWVYDGSINRQVTDSLIYDMCESYSQSECDEVIPIPITPEILEKNGWSKIEHSYLYGKEGVPFCLEIDKTELYLDGCQDDYNIAFSCLYVHELQNLLRVCGLNGQADNFKI